MLCMHGLPIDKPEHLTFEGENKAFNEVTPIAFPILTRNRRNFKRLAGVRNEDNPYFHSEPYGYLISDDPFDNNPSVYHKYFAILGLFMGIFMLKRVLKRQENGSLKNKVEDLYHAHYTACQIEDSIRAIRKEDYPYRKKYMDLKNEILGISEVADGESE